MNKKDSLGEAGTNQALRDLETIKVFLQKGRQVLEEKGIHLMLWGLLIPVGTLVFYAMQKTGYAQSVISIVFWPVLVSLGGIASAIIGIQSGKGSGSGSDFERLSTSLWIGHLVAIGVLFVTFYSRGGIYTPFFLSSVSVVIGLVFWVYGSLLDVSSFRFLGIPWWICAACIVRFDIATASLALAGTTFISSFIPGLILFLRFRRGRS